MKKLKKEERKTTAKINNLFNQKVSINTKIVRRVEKLKTFNDFSYIHKIKYNIIQLRGSKDQHKKLNVLWVESITNFGVQREKKSFALCSLSWNSLLCLLNISIYGTRSLTLAQSKAWKSRILMFLELMNMETANLVYQNTTIKPSRRKKKEKRGKISRVHAFVGTWNTFAMLEFFLHEIQFLFEKRNKYRPRHQHINQ